jgi:hypothetical protein
LFLSYPVLNYSVLRATTGSFFAALLEGISPEISVRRRLITISATAMGMGRVALNPEMPVSA